MKLENIGLYLYKMSPSQVLSFEFCASFLSNHEQLVVVFWHERKSISDTAKISTEFNTCNFDELLVKIICDALRDLAPFVQFKKREKHQWRSVTFSKVAGFCGTSKGFMRAKPFEAPQKPATLPKVTLLHGFFSRFLNCTNGKLRKTSHLRFKMYYFEIF